MADHVWRVPLLLGVMACSALVLFAASVVGSVVIHRRRSTLSTVVAAAALGGLAVAGALALRSTALHIAREVEISVSYVDPGPIGYVAPVMVAAFAFVVGRWVVDGAWASGSALMFYAWLLVFTAANVVNWCAPGWCGRFGFPFTWDSWSDVILEFEDEGLNRLVTSLRHILGAALNLLTFVGVGGVLKHVCSRRPRPDADAPPISNTP